MARPHVKLYVDIVSPFAYMGYYLTRHSPVFKQCDIEYVPAFLGGIMKDCGNMMPLQIKNKDKWINIERQRWAKLFNIPVGPPPEGFPVSTLTIQRALCALLLVNPSKLVPAIDALYKAYWAESNVALVNKPEGLTKLFKTILTDAEAEEVMKKSSQAEAKALLSKNSADAMADGCFGMPYFVATNAKGETEAFWGVDHIGQLVDHLGLDRSQQGGGWRAML